MNNPLNGSRRKCRLLNLLFDTSFPEKMVAQLAPKSRVDEKTNASFLQSIQASNLCQIAIRQRHASSLFV